MGHVQMDIRVANFIVIGSHNYLYHIAYLINISWSRITPWYQDDQQIN